MSLLILISSIGFSVNKHYCSSTGEYFYSVLGIGDSCSCVDKNEEESCHNEHKHCHKHEKEEVDEDKGCCHDEVLYVQLDADYSNEYTEINVDFDWNFVTALYFTVFDDCISLNDTPENVNYKSYKPPLSDHDIPVLNQSFLI